MSAMFRSFDPPFIHFWQGPIARLELLPVDADRAKLPGFLVRWPQKDSYDVLDAAYAEAYPDAKTETDDLRLMVVWMSGRLPYEMVDDEADDEEDSEEVEA